MSDEELESSSDEVSEEDVSIVRVLEWQGGDGRLSYLCIDTEGERGYWDRSDLMDGAKQQKLVLAYEKRDPPPWDPCCPVCGDEGCEECECPDCDRDCRFLQGVNYGCECHPVV